jgi:hypothetical protein
MGSRKHIAGLRCVMLALALGAMTGVAVEGPGGPVTEAGVLQQRVQRSFQELEQKVLQALDEIRKTDPARAAQLQTALDWAREKALAGRMNGVAELLNRGKLVEAGEQQPAMIADLAAMQELLQEELSEYDRLRKQVARVQALLQTTVELAQDQWRLMRDSENALDPQAAQKRLKERISLVGNLRTAQAELRKRTEQARANGPSALDAVRNEQQQLEQQTRAILSSIQAAGSSGGSSGGPSSPSSGSPDSPGQSGQEGQSGQPGQPNSPTPSNPPESPSRPSQAGGAAGAGGATQAGAPPLPAPANPEGETTPAARRPLEASEQLLSLALRSQMLATESLAAQKPQAAITNQEQAIVKLDVALRELHFELAKQQQPLDPQKAKAAQDMLADKTAKLFNDLLEAAPRAPGNDPQFVTPEPPGDQGQNPNSLPGVQPTLNSPYATPPGAPQQPMPGPGTGSRNVAPDFAAGVNMGASAPPEPAHPQSLGNTAPGWNSVALTRPMIRQAAQTMMKASKAIAKTRLDVAAPLQRQASKDLFVVAAQLEQWLVDNRDQTRDALRPLLKEQLQTMLTRQQSATARTRTLDELRQKGACGTNECRETLIPIIGAEKEILRIGDKLNDSLVEDRSTVAFSGVLTETRDLLEKVAEWLDRQDTGGRVQDAQQEIEEMLAQLILATEQNRQMLIAEEGSNYVKAPRQGKPPPLIPAGTEMRLVKAQQEWINQRTAAIRRASAAGLRPEQAEELRRLAVRQARVLEMTKDIIRGISEWAP